jgi:hypothetical protein
LQNTANDSTNNAWKQAFISHPPEQLLPPCTKEKDTPDLNSVGCNLTEDSNLLVTSLTVATCLDGLHDDVLSGHEGQLLLNVAMNNGRVYDQILGDILEKKQQGVAGQEGFG